MEKADSGIKKEKAGKGIMGKPKSILIGDKNDSGILIEHIKSRSVIRIESWYDSGYARSAEYFSVEEFCERLGITIKKGNQKKK